MRPAAGIVLTVVLAIASVLVLTNDSGGEQTPVDGRSLFLAKGCSGCHAGPGIPTQQQVGPDLSHLAERAGDRVEGLDAEAYVRRSIREPSAYLVYGYGDQMPTLDLSEEEVDALVVFLLSDDE